MMASISISAFYSKVTKQIILNYYYGTDKILNALPYTSLLCCNYSARDIFVYNLNNIVIKIFGNVVQVRTRNLGHGCDMHTILFI